MGPLSDILIILLGIFGFGVALHIYLKKKKGKPLVCPLRSDCNVVIHSDYSRFLGIPVEYLGMLYYIVIVLGHGVFVFFPELLNSPLLTFSRMLSAGAFFFSIYLLSIQAFVLRQWCFWCLISAVLSISIFLLTFFS